MMTIPNVARTRVCLGEVVERYNLGAAQVSVKAMIMASAGLLAAYIPGGYRVGRKDLGIEDITAEFMRQREELGLTHLMVIDQDMEFPQDTIIRLARHGLPLVAGLYFQRRIDRPIPLLFNFDGDGVCVPAGWTPGELLERDATGAGCVLIAAEVLEAMGPPWWKCENDLVGEDIHFFRRAKAAGFQLVIDTSVVCGHYVEGTLGLDDFLAWCSEHSDEFITGG